MKVHEKKLSEKELRDVFVTYKDPLYGFIMSKVRNVHDAEDLFSKSFVKFFQYAKKNPVKRSTIKSFLFKITSNTVTDFFRRKKILSFVSLDRFADPENKNSYHDFFQDAKASSEIMNIDNKNLMQKVNEQAALLPAKQKEAFYLRFIEGFSFSDIADIQSASVSTALSRVRYALDKIKKQLKSDGVLEII